MQRLTIICACLVVLPLAMTYAWREKAEGYEPDSFGDDDSAIDVFNKVERLDGGFPEASKRIGSSYRVRPIRNWCARWGDFCRPDAKMKYAQCCPGLRCMCGHFWTQGKCQCKSQGTFGRR